jgi:sugar phosphate isomerase/epimerase
MRWHRAQLEYELREKAILLRQQLLMVSGKSDAKWELLLRSVASFGTLFRHTLIALGDADGRSKREAVAALGAKLGIDISVFGELLDIRERKQDRKTADVDEVFARYLRLVEQVTAAVDKIPDSVS